MDDDQDTRPINTGYQSFNDSVSESTNPQAISSSAGATSSPSSGAIPPRYQSNQQRADRNLQDDLRQTATGECVCIYKLGLSIIMISLFGIKGGKSDVLQYLNLVS